MKVIKRFGSGLFSAWPLLLILKRKVSGLMAVICLVGGRLFDHLYPSPPWAFHHLQLTNYSIRLKVGNTHAVGQAYNFCTPSLLFARRPTLPAPTPPQAVSFLPHFASPLLPCSCALLPLSFQIWRGNEWWMGHCSCPVLAWFHCHSPSCPICSPLRRSVLPRLLPASGTLWDWVGLNRMLFHIFFPYKLWKQRIHFSWAIPRDESKTWLLYF